MSGEITARLIMNLAGMRHVDLLAVALPHADDTHLEKIAGMSRERLAAWTADKITEGSSHDSAADHA